MAEKAEWGPGGVAGQAAAWRPGTGPIDRTATPGGPAG
jgi:hypothetical protein